MSRYLGPKCKLCRREGEKLMLKGERCTTVKCAIAKKNYPPGLHGPKGRARQSGYSLQLREKQKAKRIFGILEKQFKITFLKARKEKGDTGINFMRLLETRLDNVIYRLGIGASRSQSRELITHCHIKLNDKIVNIPSTQVTTGNIIKIKESSKNLKQFANLSEKLKKIEVPGWINFEKKDMSAKILHLPGKNDFELKINPQIIIEFYSR